MITYIVFLFGVAVRAVVVGKNYVSVRIEEFCKIVVTPCVFGHSVRNLNDALRNFHVVPDVRLQNRIVETCKFNVFHISPLSVSFTIISTASVK